MNTTLTTKVFGSILFRSATFNRTATLALVRNYNSTTKDHEFTETFEGGDIGISPEGYKKLLHEDDCSAPWNKKPIKIVPCSVQKVPKVPRDLKNKKSTFLDY
ncbi:hypothetical protein BB559_000627 [Furculomyces boomerangus]|uniref:Uncharacterized protein n=2 Tax=Harpellales TaxID=61421 RepID=A0A2T9Z4J9_9FUNG|nr:hypothetical protein BB559_000627 [Furculomyces boomerangus]PVZ97005.1 hypothetical protein BB558_007055 [Smittium angustum]